MEILKGGTPAPEFPSEFSLAGTSGQRLALSGFPRADGVLRALEPLSGASS